MTLYEQLTVAATQIHPTTAAASNEALGEQLLKAFNSHSTTMAHETAVYTHESHVAQ